MLPEANLEELETHFRVAFDHSDVTVDVLPHAEDFLKYCRSRGVRCFILTSVNAGAFAVQCKALGVDGHFDAIHSGIRPDRKSVG